jgi:SNF2 family DNA or RNA helicase
MKNWTHQEAAIEKFKDKDFAALLMEVGCGKSRTAIEILDYQFQKNKIDAVLLIVPSGLRWQWKDQQLPMHSPRINPVVVWESTKARNKRAVEERRTTLWEAATLPWFIVNVEAFSTDAYMDIFESYVKYHKCAIVVDESTKIKTLSANRTINITRLAASACTRIILTGTPVTNSPLDLYAQFLFLKPFFWGAMSYFGFRNRYAIHKTEQNPFGGKYQKILKPHDINKIRAQASNPLRSIQEVAAYNGMEVRDVQYIVDHPDMTSPYRHMSELKDIIDSASVTVRKEEVLDQLPERSYNTITVDMTPVQKKIYKDLHKSMIAEHLGQTLSVPNKLALLLRLQQVAGGFFPNAEGGTSTCITGANPKMLAVIDELEDSPDQVVIWARFTSEIKMLAQGLTVQFPDRVVRMYYGDIDHDDRAKTIVEFQKGEVDVLVANAATAGHGLNLQTCHRAIYYSNDYSLENRLQSEGRLHRSGQKNAVSYLDIEAAGTVDQEIHKVLTEKLNVADYFSGRSLVQILGTV